MQSFLSCNRQWWLVRKARAPEIEKGFKNFGTILHGVLERYLKADDVGRDPATGKSVDLYPEGWMSAVERDGTVITVTQADGLLIKRLVKQAIADGILVRIADRRIEGDFTRYVCAFKYKGKVTKLYITGKIDVSHPTGIDDHKSTKTMKYAKSKRALEQDIQMLLYAHEFFEKCAESGEPIPDTCDIAHNVYCKDPNKPRVKRTKTTVTREQVEKFWKETYLPAMKAMVRIKTLDDWRKVPGPAVERITCNAYGGCSFRGICNGRERLDAYIKRVTRIRARSQKPTEESTQMATSILTKKISSTKAPAAAAKGAIKKTIDVKAETVKSLKVRKILPPWAKKGCNACQNPKAPNIFPGFNSKLDPCKICDEDAAEKEGNWPLSTWFNITFAEDGSAVKWDVKEAWKKKFGIWGRVNERTDPASAVMQGISAEAPAKIKTKVVDADDEEVAPEDDEEVADEEEAADDEGEESEETPEDDDEAAPEDEEEAAPEEDDEPEAPEEEKAEAKLPTRGRGRPRKGFTLYIGTYMSIGNRGTPIYLETVLASFGKAIAKAQKVESYYELDAFARRDLLATCVDDIVEQLGTQDVLVSVSPTPDTAAILSVLRPMAAGVCERMG